MQMTSEWLLATPVGSSHTGKIYKTVILYQEDIWQQDGTNPIAKFNALVVTFSKTETTQNTAIGF